VSNINVNKLSTMSIAEGKQRQKEATKRNIMEAAFRIIKEEGWQALSMRRIANVIEYTAPVIYEYFSGKEGLLLAFAKKGFNMLAAEIQRARDAHLLPAEKLKAMWLAYWNFAVTEKELYQVMFGVEMISCEPQQTFLEADKGYQLFACIIAELIGDHSASPADELSRKFYTFWSVIHGLVSINMVRKQNSDVLNTQILNDAIDAIIGSMQQSLIYQ
jgi:AcrR family transcriptional regulator